MAIVIILLWKQLGQKVETCVKVFSSRNLKFVWVFKYDYELQWNIYDGTMVLISWNEKLKKVCLIEIGYMYVETKNENCDFSWNR